METSVFIAKLFGVLYIVIAAGMLVNRDNYQKLMADFFKNAAVIFYGGFMALVVGLLIVLSHNVWTADWRVIITLIGWAALLKGVWLIVFPNTVHPFMEACQKNKALSTIRSFAALALGIVLSFFGFFVN